MRLFALAGGLGTSSILSNGSVCQRKEKNTFSHKEAGHRFHLHRMVRSKSHWSGLCSCGLLRGFKRDFERTSSYMLSWQSSSLALLQSCLLVCLLFGCFLLHLNSIFMIYIIELM